MCFSTRVSLVTGALCWLTALYIHLQTPELKQEAIYLAIFSSMQYADAVLHAHPEKTPINWAVTSLVVPLILSIQLVNNVYRETSYGPVWLVPAVAYIFWRFHGYSEPSCNPWKSPVWGGREISLVEFLLFSSLIMYPSWKPLLSTWLYMLVVVRLVKGGYGSMWCSFACVYSLKLIAASLKLQYG